MGVNWFQSSLQNLSGSLWNDPGSVRHLLYFAEDVVLFEVRDGVRASHRLGVQHLFHELELALHEF